jgi:hypothetical protein
MKVAFTPEADRQATELDGWWREHRPAAPDLFAREPSQSQRSLGVPDFRDRFTRGT